MKVIITGGTGLIGSALAKSLVDDNHEAIVLSRSPMKAKNLPPAVQVVEWDARSAKGWGHLAEGADAIVNLAGENLAEGRWTDERKERIGHSRLNAGQAVVEAVEGAKTKPQLIIQASGVNYYGTRQAGEIGEDAPPGDDFLAQVCIEWEASTAPVEPMGVRRVIIRTSPVLSTEGGALSRMLLPFKMFVGGPVGRGDQGFSWLHLSDEVAAIRFLLDTPTASGPFNLTAPNPVTNAKFSRALGKALHRPAIMPIPGFMLRLLYGEMATVILEGQLAVPNRLTELGFTFEFPHVEGALQDVVG
jgi:uncharacterized protein (TIGR01777 family)